MVEVLARVGLFCGIGYAELTNPTPHNLRTSPYYRVHALPKRAPRVPVFRSSLSGTELAGEDVLEIFLKDRQLNGDIISRASDMLWQRDGLQFIDSEASVLTERPQQLEEFIEAENDGGFLKLTKTQEWVSGQETAPINKKASAKELQDDRERRRKLSFLNYEALKRELMLLTAGIGTACTGYCLVAFSIQAAISYSVGVLLSCLYLQLLYDRADNLSKEVVPQIFMQKKVKKIGIRSEDLTNLLERTVKGSSIALSSPRLVIPAAIYGIWGLSQHFPSGFFDFQILPAMFGMFAYKAAALVQIYRDNKDLNLIFPESDESSIN